MPSKDVDAALTNSFETVGRAVLGLPEDQWFDRKSIRTAPRDLAQAISAFANAEGGTIVVGLHNGRVEGINSQYGKINDFRQAPIDFIDPPVRSYYEEIACINENGDLDKLLIIRIDPGERVHEMKGGDCYLRIGDESRKLSFNLRQELQFDRGQSQYDGFPAEVDMSALDGRLVNQYQRAVKASSSTESLFRARSLLTSSGQLTNAGYLLFGVHPQDVFPQAHIRVLKFLDVERGTGARLGLEDDGDIRIEGPIPYAIQRAQKVIEKMLPKRRALAANGRFEPTPIVPRDAWLEGLVNAVVHRSYSLSGDHIRIEIFPNRVEIESPGRFPGLANPQEPLKISRFARNPRIARVCADLRIGQELGEGIRRIFEEMRQVGLSDPVYAQTQGSVRLLLTATPRIDQRTAARMPSGSQNVLDALRRAGKPLGTGELIEFTNLSRPYLLTRLRALEKEGLIRWNGKSPQDPRAVWLIPTEN